MISKKVSIIVPVYNGEDTIDKCVGSLMKQDFDNFELIIVNDGSTDHTEEICKKYAENDSRIKLITTKNQGVSFARNLGISVSVGEYLGFVDIDDYVESAFISTLVKNMEEKNVDISVCNYYYEVNSVPYPISISHEYIGLLDQGKFLEGIISDCYRGFLWNKLFRRELIEINGDILKMKDGITICEDLLFVVTVASKARSFFVDNQPLYHYVQNDNSAYNAKFKENRLTEIIAYDEILSIIQETIPTLLCQYKETYLKMALKIQECYSCIKNKDKKIEIRISDAIDKYYIDVLKTASIKKKIYYSLYKRCPQVIHFIKKIYHLIKY